MSLRGAERRGNLITQNEIPRFARNDTVWSFNTYPCVIRVYISPDSSDQIVISKAQELDTILISLNGDFADIVTYPPKKYKGIFALQVRNHPEIIPHLMERLKNYLSANPEMNHYKGKLLLVEVHRIRVRE
ncbi:MAG: DUF5615 family PIN-like protein [Nitrospirota bacterium]